MGGGAVSQEINCVSLSKCCRSNCATQPHFLGNFCRCIEKSVAIHAHCGNIIS